MNGESSLASGGAESPLLGRFLRGDRRVTARMEAVARRAVGARGYFIPREHRDDVVQEVLLDLWRAVRAPGFRLSSELEALVRCLAYRRCVDWLRHRRISVAPDPGEASGDRGPEEQAALRERVELGRRVLAGIREACREMFRLHVTREMSYREIAESLGRTEGAVRTQMYECLKQARRLREKLERRLVVPAEEAT